MINYLNIYNQLQTLDSLKSIMINNYEGIIGVCMLVILFATAICIVSIISIYNLLQFIKKNGSKLKHVGLCIIIIPIAAILTIIIIYAIIIRPTFNTITMIKNNNIDIIELCKNDTYISSKYKDKIDDQITYKELQDILTVNGVTNIDTFNANITYLKETYRKKVNIFKATYDKEVTTSEHEYVNSILNQFYLGKIGNTPTDITSFEEDYPRVSINLKK